VKFETSQYCDDWGEIQTNQSVIQLSAHQYYLDRVFIYALTVKGATPQNRWLHSLHSVQSAKKCIRSIKRKQLLLEAGVCMAFLIYEENSLRD
jgi:hypothetical protein